MKWAITNVKLKIRINNMNIAAAYAIAEIVKESELNEDYVIPNALNKDISMKVAEAVKKAAKETGVARI